jgi:hypothetical protein
LPQRTARAPQPLGAGKSRATSRPAPFCAKVVARAHQPSPADREAHVDRPVCLADLERRRRRTTDAQAGAAARLGLENHPAYAVGRGAVAILVARASRGRSEAPPARRVQRHHARTAFARSIAHDLEGRADDAWIRGQGRLEERREEQSRTARCARVTDDQRVRGDGLVGCPGA